MHDRLVDLVDGLLEAAAGELVVFGELRLEVVHLVLKVRDVDILPAHQLQLRAVLQAVKRRVAQQRDHGNEELRADDVHLGIAVGHVHDAAVVQLAVALQQGDQHGVLAALLPAVLVQLPEEVLVLVLGGGRIHLVLHLEHDGNELHALVRAVPVDEVALAAGARVVVLFKRGVLERQRADAVELRHAVLLQALADHLGGLLRLEVTVVRDLLVLLTDLQLVLLLRGFGAQLRGQLLPVHLVLQLHDLRVPALHGILHGEPRVRLALLQAALQLRDLRVLARQLQLPLRLRLPERGLLLRVAALQSRLELGDLLLLLAARLRRGEVDRQLFFGQLRLQLRDLLLLLAARLRHGEVDRHALFGHERPLALRNLLSEFVVAHLLDDGRVSGFIDLKHFPALGALDFLHNSLLGS